MDWTSLLVLDAGLLIGATLLIVAMFVRDLRLERRERRGARGEEQER